jgi:hypothetical protein
LFFALFISLLVIETSAQIAPQSGDSPTQSSAAPTAVTSAQVLFTVSDDSGNAVPAPAKDSVRLRIDKQPVEIEEIRSLKNTPLFFRYSWTSAVHPNSSPANKLQRQPDYSPTYLQVKTTVI